MILVTYKIDAHPPRQAGAENVSARRYRVPHGHRGHPLAAEIEAPALKEAAWRILEAEASRFGVSLEPGDVLLRRAGNGPELHIMAAADELVRHLGAAQDPLGEDSPLIVRRVLGRWR